MRPDFAGRSFTSAADVICSDDTEGCPPCLWPAGCRLHALFVKDRRRQFDYNLAGRHTILTSDQTVPAGDGTLGIRLDKRDQGAVITVLINGKPSGEAAAPQTFPAGFGCLSAQAGHNGPSPVSPHSASPFRFTVKLRTVDIELADDRADIREDAFRGAFMTE